MDLSIGAKFKGEGTDMDFLGYTDVDSIDLGNYPALRKQFAYRSILGYTLIQDQTIVQLPYFSLFYINYRFKLNKTDSFDIIDMFEKLFNFNENLTDHFQS